MQEHNTPDISVAPQSVEEKIQSLQQRIAQIRKTQRSSLCVMAVLLGLFLLVRHLLMPAVSNPGDAFAGLAAGLDAAGPYVIVLSGFFPIVFGQLLVSDYRCTLKELQKPTQAAG